MDPAVVVAIITGLFGTAMVFLQTRTNKQIKTNHGKTIGQHAEAASTSAEVAAAKAEAAKFAVELVALQLEAYKAQQAAEALAQQKTIESYVEVDAAAHADLRELILTTSQQTQENTRIQAAAIKAAQEKE